MCRAFTQSLPHLNDSPESFQQIQGVMHGQHLLIKDREQIIDDLPLGFFQQEGFRKDGVR